MTLHAVAPRDPRVATEDKIHKAAIQLLRLAAHPRLVYWHTPNGEARSSITGAKLKTMGVLPGVADLCFVLPGGRAAFIEIKAKAGRQSPEQRLFQARVTEAGGLYAVCHSHEEICSVLSSWGALRSSAPVE